MRRSAIIALFATITSLFIVFGHANAQENELSFSLSPAIVEIVGEPGDLIESSVIFSNGGDLPTAGFLESDPLVPIDNIVDQARRSEFDASSWIEIDTRTVAFEAGVQKEVPFVINIPETANPGGHYALVTLKPGVIQGSVEDTVIIPELSASIFITVAGEINEQADIVDEDIKIGSVIRGRTVKLSFRIRNTGNVHILPAPRLIINKDDKPIEIFSLQPQLILPNTEKAFEIEWPADVDFGAYGIRVETTYGSESIPLNTPIYSFNVVPNFLQLVLYGLIASTIVWLIVKRKNIPRTIAVLRGHAHIRSRSYKRSGGDESLPKDKTDVRTLDEIAAEIERQERQPILGLPDRSDSKESDEITDLTQRTPAAKKPATKPKVISKTRLKDPDKTTFITQTSASTIVREASPFFDPEAAEEQPAVKIPVQEHEDKPAKPVKRKTPATKKSTTAKKTAKKKAPAKKAVATKKATPKKTATKTAKKTAKTTVVKTPAKKKPASKKATPAKKTTKKTKTTTKKTKTAPKKKSTTKKTAKK